MKVIHKNSREEYDLYSPVYCKQNGAYGRLTYSPCGRIYFFYNDNMDDLTDDFEVPENNLIVRLKENHAMMLRLMGIVPNKYSEDLRTEMYETLKLIERL